jgi:hypothetical protein
MPDPGRGDGAHLPLDPEAGRWRIQPRTLNRLHNGARFMFAWDNPARIRSHVPIERRLSPAGNINKNGDTSPTISALATRHHPEFLAIIEPGVRDLVEVLALRHDLITYTSCEGHRPGSGTMPTERHAGVLPRDAAELSAVVAMFVEAADVVNSACDCDTVRLGIMVHEALDGEKKLPAVDLFIHRVSHGIDWTTYFGAVDAIYERLVRELARHAALHAAPDRTAEAL